ncbi:ATP-binding protein [Microbispora sp. NPDC049125]|uniref:sensor histidine kinase n=1 Tax=Microbispora sp. NPDC049125 TaxID=3154929 RepID=UPI003466A4A3
MVVSSRAGRAAGSRKPTGLSLRGRLLLITMALLATGLVVSSAVAVATLRSHLIGRVDQQLTPIASLASRFSPALLRVPVSDDGGQAMRLAPGSDLLDQMYVAYLSPGGTVEAQRQVSLRGGVASPRLPRLDAAAVAKLGGNAFDVPGEAGGGKWRAVALPVTTSLPVAGQPGSALGRLDTAKGGSVVVAASLEGVRSTVGRLTVVCMTTAAVLMALLAAIGWFAVRAGLRPLRGIEETAAAIASGDLSRRVPETAPRRTEVGRLATALNGMLGQIETAFADRERSQARMRRFVADVSHELRTPLFGIKGFTELHRMGGLPDTDRTLARIESEAGRLARLVEDLLLLARLDEGEAALPMDLAPMDLRTLAADAYHDLSALDPDRPVTLTGPDGGAPEEATVRGDEARLRQVVSNLVGNAVTHTPTGTAVRIAVGKVGGEGVLTIEDEGPGMPEEEAGRVFDRFYRVDGSRSRATGGGAGLGLAIVQSIVTAHGGRVEVRTAPGKGAAFQVALPLL